LLYQCQKTRKVALSIARKFDNFGIEIGGLWAGQPLNGREFQLEREGKVYQDVIRSKDNFGGKVKLTFTTGAVQWYGLTSYMGLVANGGFDQTKNFYWMEIERHWKWQYVQCIKWFYC
jgi:hypothetical protein